jgi:imidazolonepropionase-like amidohydrolase
MRLYSSNLCRNFVCAVVLASSLVCWSAALAQIKPSIGIRQNTPSIHALTNARIVISPGHVVEKGTLVMRNGIITAVGANVSIPADARVWDVSGMTIYPGLIDSYSDVGVPKKPQPGQGQGQDQQKSAESKGPKHWNSNVLASQHAEDMFAPDVKAAEKMRGMGFTTVFIVPQKGIFRGAGALMNLGDGTANQSLVRPNIAQCVSFETSSGDEYPNSLMGSIALIRQTFLDAQWQRSAMQAAQKYPDEPKFEYAEDLASLEDAISAKQPVIFEATDELSILRASHIAREFSLKAWARGSGNEYKRLDAVKATAMPLILPINFPEVPSVQTPEDALNVSLEDLCAWDEAPENPKRLQQAGVPFVFTTATLKDPTSFLPNIRKAIDRGLSVDAALAALTISPAKLFGVEKALGTLDVGKIANIVVTDGDLFYEKTKIRETWVSGKRYEVKAKPEFDPRGTWLAFRADAPSDTLTIVLKGEVDGLQGTLKAKGKETKATTASLSDLRLALTFTGDSIGFSGVVRMSAAKSGEKLVGSGELADGKIFSWTASMKEPFKAEPDTTKPKPPVTASFPPVFPPGSFGRMKLPDQPAHIVVRDATIWTSGPQGTIQHGDMIVERGKIVSVGQHLAAPADAVVVDGKGKHITAGLIDCHSHTGVTGSVNEAGKAITAEVRIGDVLDPDDIALYRELAGGLTAANVLHGSANPIGGQNQVIKLRWGVLPEEMKFEGAIPGIKFALGENPKQSNWGEKYTTRYPQTRGGVEQIIRDEFRAAQDYERAWKDFESGKQHIPLRRDLQAEAILEVLKGKRIVHAHSYRQDEIEMLMRVAEDFGFRVGTFQHVLEGYKVADQMAKHGAGASTFSDWWAYKFEVYDAIPYNGALMHDAGVVVSYNSDSDEQARRLNTEAAKAVKYGGVSEEEALKFVTINPAKQLRVDKRVGSLEVGKDADFVVWNGNPLSTYSLCEQTWIDGKKYFDRDEDRKMNDEVTMERATLIQKVLGAKKGPGADSKSQPSMGNNKEGYSCHDEFVGKENR